MGLASGREGFIVHATAIVTDDEIRQGWSIAVVSGRIERVFRGEPPGTYSGFPIVNGKGLYLAPGFIDLHIHGTGEHLVEQGREALECLSGLLPSYGVTGFLPTVCPRPKGEDARFLTTLAKANPKGAAILGFHLEGPFLTITGALPEEALGQADVSRVSALIDAAAPFGAIFSVSPDFEGIAELIPFMKQGGRPVFMTHTRASVAQTRAAIEAGARHATHFYDVFPVPAETDAGVRPCGAVEAILADARVTVDFILDGEHVDPAAVELALACKGPGGVSLITDANIGAGLPPHGVYRFGEDEVTFACAGGPARMTANSRFPGGLAGSGLTMNLAVRNAIRFLKCGLPLAVRLASQNPATVLGLNKHKGSIAEGYDADLVLFDDNIEIHKTWVAGTEVYSRQDDKVTR